MSIPVYTTQSAEESKLAKLFSNVGDYFLDRAIEKTGLIKYGPNAGGNLSEAQLKAGERPVEPTIIQSNPYANQLLASVGLGMGNGGGANTMLFIGGGVLLIGAILLLRK